ncbi:MAG: hypothetical protein H0T46_21825 [Deltaproteobacteria bacterium]|nr:hypothetical protein [Deltaproteobacteria bacterium]
MRRLVLAVMLAGCVSAPRPLDVDGMVKAKGLVIARQDLEVRALDEPRDIQVHLALAKLADQTKRPSQAIAALETVLRIGGPLGTRWHAEDRARFARLLAARGRIRLDRGAASALEDLTRAKSYGAAIDATELDRARAAVALAKLRHVDAKERAAGQRMLAQLSGSSIADPTWLGAKSQPVPRDRGEWGMWLWERGAKRAAFEALRDWQRTTSVKGGPLHDAYLRALSWWTPYDLPPPAGTDIAGPERCRFAGACRASDVLDDPAASAALLAAPMSSRDDDAAAWLSLSLGPALRGEAGWGEAAAIRIDLPTLSPGSLPPYARSAGARLAGKRESGVPDSELASLTPQQRLVVAAGRALDGGSSAQVRVALGSLAGSPEGIALLRILDPAPPVPLVDPFAVALTAHLRARRLDAIPLSALLDAYSRNPSRADILAADVVAEAPDDAVAQAALGAMFDVLEDPARARAAWQGAVDASPEPAFLAGLAESMARANDPDAAMIQATAAAAAHGDPAVIWVSVSRALDALGKHVHALEAARSAIDLAGPETIGPALDAAISASRALGRDAQVLALTERRRQVPTPVRVDRGTDDPTDAVAALAANKRTPGVLNIARMWVASRWNPRDVSIRAELLDSIAPDDPRRATLVTELVALAADPDVSLARAALAALR